MKLTNYGIIYASIFLLFLMVLVFNNTRLRKQTVEDIEMQRVLTESTKAALQEADIDEFMVFAEENTREKVVDAFYRQLDAGLGYSGSRDALAYANVPFVVLVDNDGFYISYWQVDKDVDGNNFDARIITNLHSFTANYNGYLVRYFQDDVIEVSDPTGEIHTGIYSKIYDELSNPVALNFMSSLSGFTSEKYSVIVGNMEDELSYYIKNYNNGMNDMHQEYMLSIPATDLDPRARVLDAPSIISFYQGPQKSSTKGYINVYAFSGSILDDATLYYEEKDSHDDLYYHLPSCSHLTDPAAIEGKTMEDCAKDGAIPCPYCVK